MAASDHATIALRELPREYNAASDFIDQHAALMRPAVIDACGSYSYAELAERVNRAGNTLCGVGVGREQRVLMCLTDTIDFPSVFWGAIKIGAVPVPVNTLLTADDYRHMLLDSRAAALVVSAALYPTFAPLLDKHPTLRAVIVSDPAAVAKDAVPPDVPRLSALMAQAKPELTPVATTADDAAFWLYTSGSTGAPKGAVHLHRNLAQTAQCYGRGVLNLSADDRVFSAAKLFFAYGLGNAMTFPLDVAASAVLLEQRPTPDAIGALLREHRPTVFFGVPTLYAAMLADPELSAERLGGRLRMCISAGEALPEDTAKRWQQRIGVPLLDGIGSTEMLHIFLSNRADDVRFGSTGKAVPGYRLRLTDDDGQVLEPGADAIGELWVDGPSAALGYWNQREKSLHSFQGPWTRTGDKYRADADGYYYYCGRTDDMLKVSGQWVSPFDVEAALAEHSGVLEAAVVGQADEQQMIKPKAYIVLTPDVSASAALDEELKMFIKQRLAPFKYPRWIEFVDALPKTSTGKIQRFKLR